MMITWLIRLLLFVSLFLLLRRLFRYLFGAGRAKSRLNRSPNAPGAATRAIAGRTVKDPQCGMYVATTLALPLKEEGEMYYFCSEKCRDLYQKKHLN
jgi:YHS domain-containing protein